MKQPNYIIADDLEDDSKPKVDLTKWIEKYLSNPENRKQASMFYQLTLRRNLKNGTSNNLHNKK